jgi:hypothetical protein
VYTWSKSKDTNSLSSAPGPGGVVLQDSTNIAGDYAFSDFDARHRYVLNAIWDLPFKGNQLKEGWQIAVITQGQTGNPINILTNLNFSGNANIRPDLVGTIDVVGRPEQWYSTGVCNPAVAGSCTSSSVFALPTTPGNHFGNLPRNAVTGPGFYNTDLSLIKKTKVGGTVVELRAEAFNVFNHPNLGTRRSPGARPRWGARASGSSPRHGCPPGTPAPPASSSSL